MASGSPLRDKDSQDSLGFDPPARRHNWLAAAWGAIPEGAATVGMARSPNASADVEKDALVDLASSTSRTPVPDGLALVMALERSYGMRVNSPGQATSASPMS